MTATFGESCVLPSGWTLGAARSKYSYSSKYIPEVGLMCKNVHNSVFIADIFIKFGKMVLNWTLNDSRNLYQKQTLDGEIIEFFHRGPVFFRTLYKFIYIYIYIYIYINIYAYIYIYIYKCIYIYIYINIYIYIYTHTYTGCAKKKYTPTKKVNNFAIQCLFLIKISGVLQGPI